MFRTTRVSPSTFYLFSPPEVEVFLLAFCSFEEHFIKKKNCWTHTYVHKLTNEKNWRNKDVRDRLYQFPDCGLTHLLETQNSVLGGKAMLGVHWISLSYFLQLRVNVQ